MTEINVIRELGSTTRKTNEIRGESLSYRNQTIDLVWNQWIGFYMTGASVMKELSVLQRKVLWKILQSSRKQLRWCPFLLKRLRQKFFCKFFKIFQNTFLARHVLAIAPVDLKQTISGLRFWTSSTFVYKGFCFFVKLDASLLKYY